MKIALVVKDHVESKGGLERYGVGLARALAGRGCEVHVFANVWDDMEGVIFHYVPYTKWSSFLKVITFPVNAARLLSADSFDIVYGLTPMYPLDIYRVGEGLHVDALRLRFPGTFKRALRYLNPKHLAILGIERKVFSSHGARCVITNSAMVAGRLRTLYDVSEHRVHVVYNGFDGARFNPNVKRFREEVRAGLGIQAEEPVLLFASNDFFRKGLDHLLRALAVLKREGDTLKLIVAGRPSGAARYEKMAAAEGVAGQVVFIGHTGDIERIYGAVDMVVLPTRYDPFSNVCLEAMACALPVVTTRDNGACEIITQGTDGFVVESGADTPALSRAIKKLLEGAFYKAAGARAAEKASGFSMDRNISKTMEIMEALSGKNA